MPESRMKQLSNEKKNASLMHNFLQLNFMGKGYGAFAA